VSLLFYLVALAVAGIVVGALARLALPGRDPLTLWQTMLVGWAGSFSAGLISYALLGRNYAGVTVSILGATVVMYFVRRSRGGGLLDPGKPRPRR
jgi:uncharacterized membrane protein YeaQ/YmgE (transglycosylase-associated protein family)